MCQLAGLLQVLQPHKAKELQQSLAKPQSLAGLSEALTALKARLESEGVAYKDLTGGLGHIAINALPSSATT